MVTGPFYREQTPTISNGSACGAVTCKKWLSPLGVQCLSLELTRREAARPLGSMDKLHLEQEGRKGFRYSERLESMGAKTGVLSLKTFKHRHGRMAAKPTSWIIHHCPTLFWGRTLIYEHRFYCYWLQFSQRHFINWEVCLFAYVLFPWEFPCIWT